MPQAQISRIESGAVDLRLSTFLEMARLLDLEVVLTPRDAVSVVNALVRDADHTANVRSVHGVTTMLNQAARALKSKDPESPIAQRLEALAQDLYHLLPAIRMRGAMAEFTRLAANLDAELRAESKPARLMRYLDRLTHLRNSLANPAPDAERPAYSLDGEG